jgi:hypothetical protein
VPLWQCNIVIVAGMVLQNYQDCGCTQLFCSGQAMLVPSSRIVALMMPKIMELADGMVLNIIEAIEYVKQTQKEKREWIKLLDFLKVLQECAIAMPRVRLYRTRFHPFVHARNSCHDR